jgi:molecular chaperone HscA
VEARVDADRMVMAIESALQADADLLSEGEQQAIAEATQQLIAAKASDDAATVESHTKALAQATEAFAAMRMNRGIAQALAGKNIAAL